MKCKVKLMIFSCLLAVCSNAVMAESTENNQEHLAAAHELLKAMQLDKTFKRSIEETVDLQIKANPNIKKYREVMLNFFEKYMSWDSMKDEMAQLYAEDFSIEDLKELTKFYKSPVGIKAALLMPQLMKKGGELGMKRVQNNMSELQLMIAEENKKIAEENISKKRNEAEGK